MTDLITLTGFVATLPRHLITSEGLSITSFRLASTQRRFDRSRSAWIDGETNWYTVTTFRQLAANAASSIKKGERVLVTGRLRIRDWESGEKTGTTVEVEADALGHDLSWGTASFSRTILAPSATPDGDPRPEEADAQAAGSSQATEEAGVDSDSANTGVDEAGTARDSAASELPVPF